MRIYRHTYKINNNSPFWIPIIFIWLFLAVDCIATCLTDINSKSRFIASNSTVSFVKILRGRYINITENIMGYRTYVPRSSGRIQVEAY